MERSGNSDIESHVRPMFKFAARELLQLAFLPKNHPSHRAFWLSVSARWSSQSVWTLNSSVATLLSKRRVLLWYRRRRTYLFETPLTWNGRGKVATSKWVCSFTRPRPPWASSGYSAKTKSVLPDGLFSSSTVSATNRSPLITGCPSFRLPVSASVRREVDEGD